MPEEFQQIKSQLMDMDIELSILKVFIDSMHVKFDKSNRKQTMNNFCLFTMYSFNLLDPVYGSSSLTSFGCHFVQ